MSGPGYVALPEVSGHKLLRIEGERGVFVRVAVCECGKKIRVPTFRAYKAAQAHAHHVEQTRHRALEVDPMNPATWPDGKAPA